MSLPTNLELTEILKINGGANCHCFNYIVWTYLYRGQFNPANISNICNDFCCHARTTTYFQVESGYLQPCVPNSTLATYVNTTVKPVANALKESVGPITLTINLPPLTISQ